MVIVASLVGMLVAGIAGGVISIRAGRRPLSLPVARVAAAAAVMSLAVALLAASVLLNGPGPIPAMLPVAVGAAVSVLAAFGVGVAAVRLTRRTIELSRSYESLDRLTDAVIESELLPRLPVAGVGASVGPTALQRGGGPQEAATTRPRPT